MNPFVEARNVGISAIPVRPGSKQPAVSWKPFQEAICTEMQAQEWGANGHGFGVGFVTGEVSGRLMAIDIEAVFVGRLAELAVRLRAAGVYDVFKTWMDGYSESTPRGGLHILVRVEGEGRCPPNERFASDSAGVLIESRGEGGYVIVAPTVGYLQAHGSYETICYCTVEEWLAVVAVLATFDEAPPPVSEPPRGATPQILRLDDSWIDDVKTGLPPIRQILEDRGWQFPGTGDRFGQHVVRPGKNPRDGHSANLSHDGYLHVHSTNADLPTGVGLDAVDILYFYAHGHIPTLDERTEWLKAQRQPAGAGAGAPSGTAPLVAALNLPAEFWQARPYLAHIHQAALSLRLSPDAVWEAVKCFYAATIPWNHRLPGDGTFDYVAIVVGRAGAGKSRAKHCAFRLLEACHQLDGIAFPAPAGSGEGMTDLYLDRDNKDRRYKLRGVGFYADEGKYLLDIASRTGNTTIQAIKQMWSGELTGSVAATQERHRWLAPRDVRATLLVSSTPDVAADFCGRDLTEEGLPQRISWGWAEYPHPDQKPDWPGPLDIHTWPTITNNLYEIELAPDLAKLIDNRLLAAARGQQTDDGLEGHATYATEKCAGIHAHLDGRLHIDNQDWALAEQDWKTTRTIRQHVANTRQTRQTDRNTTTGQDRADQQVAETDRLLERAYHSLQTKLIRSKNPLTNRQIKDHLRTFHTRHRIKHTTIIDLIIARGGGVMTDDGLTATRGS